MRGLKLVVTVNGVSLANRRVLIVEDNFHIAVPLARVLKAQGAEILGPVGNVSDALALIAETDRIDGAVLDINLHGKMVYPVVVVWRSKGVAMVFMTGYDEGSIDPAYAELPRLQKPATVERLIKVLFG